MSSVAWFLLFRAHLNLHAQLMDIFLREILGKLTGLLKTTSFQSHTIECPAIGDSSPVAPPDTAKPSAPNQFEGQLLEALASTTVIRQYQNVSYRYEYYLNVDVYGRDGNNQRLEADESPVLMDLASIDNVEFIPTSNITLKAPRRFFRLGVTKVTCNSNFHHLQEFWGLFSCFILFFNFSANFCFVAQTRQTWRLLLLRTAFAQFWATDLVASTFDPIIFLLHSE